MNNIHFKSINELEDFLNNLTIVGIGSESTCYLLNNKVIKYLNGPYAKIIYEDEVEFFQKFNKLKSFVFSNGIVYANDQIKGLIMPYVKGATVGNYNFNSSDLLTLISKIKTVKYDILNLSKEGIKIEDLASLNIIVNNNLDFTIIDTNTYTLTEDINLANENISFFNYIICNELFKNLKVSIDKILSLDSEFSSKDVYKHFDEFLVNIYQKVANEVETPKVKDIKALIKRP